MKARTKRGLAVLAGLTSLGLATTLILQAFQSNLVFFFSPTQVLAQEAPLDRAFRVGGLVEEGSIQRDGQSLTIRFVVTDMAERVPVIYTGLVPDLFREGKGVVAQGRLGVDGVFMASQVLAKHDEEYMPPEAADALARGQALKQQRIEAAAAAPPGLATATASATSPEAVQP